MIQLAQDNIYPIWLLMSKDIFYSWYIYNVVPWFDEQNNGFEFDQSDLGILTSSNSLCQILTSRIFLMELAIYSHAIALVCSVDELHRHLLPIFYALWHYITYQSHFRMVLLFRSERIFLFLVRYFLQVQFYMANVIYSIPICLRLLVFGYLLLLYCYWAWVLDSSSLLWLL